MGNCECSLSRPLRPATYASLPQEFVSGCIDHASMFGRNFDALFGVKVQDLEVRPVHRYNLSISNINNVYVDACTYAQREKEVVVH